MPTSLLSGHDSERGFALQKYLLLHSQHDALQKHLSQITPAMAIRPSGASLGARHTSISNSFSSSASDDEYLSSSPPTHTRHHQRSGSIPYRRPMLKTRRSSLPAVIDESIMNEMAEDEQKIVKVNQQIKGTLTELLNCQSVKRDERYRRWVQTKLMDAEKELKSKRSHSCGQRRLSEDMGVF